MGPVACKGAEAELVLGLGLPHTGPGARSLLRLLGPGWCRTPGAGALPRRGGCWGSGEARGAAWSGDRAPWATVTFTWVPGRLLMPPECWGGPGAEVPPGAVLAAGRGGLGWRWGEQREPPGKGCLSLGWELSGQSWAFGLRVELGTRGLPRPWVLGAGGG